MRLRIGKTQGMTLSSRPPNSAPSMASRIVWPPPLASSSTAAIGAPAAGTSPGVAVRARPTPGPISSTPSIEASEPAWRPAPVSTISMVAVARDVLRRGMTESIERGRKEIGVVDAGRRRQRDGEAQSPAGEREPALGGKRPRQRLAIAIEGRVARACRRRREARPSGSRVPGRRARWCRRDSRTGRRPAAQHRARPTATPARSRAGHSRARTHSSSGPGRAAGRAPDIGGDRPASPRAGATEPAARRRRRRGCANSRASPASGA